MSGRPWTTDEQRRLAALWRHGYGAGRIASMLGRTQCSVYQKAAQLGVSSKRRRDWTHEEAERARELWGEGAMMAEIAEELGRTTGAVSQYVARHRDEFPRRRHV